MNDKKKSIFSILILSLLLSDNFKIEPIAFSHHSSNGSDWIYKNTPISIFGAGLGAYYGNKNWTVEAEYIQFGFIGELKEDLFAFSTLQSFKCFSRSSRFINLATVTPSFVMIGRLSFC